MVRNLGCQGIRTSVTTLKMMEKGDNRSINILIAMLRLYDSRANLTPGLLESGILDRSHKPFNVNVRMQRYIAANLHRCDREKLKRICRIIQDME